MNLIIALGLVTIVIVGSIVWIRPSPRDKKLAAWRRDALVAGLKVKLEGFKAEPKESGIRENIEGASYQLLNSSPDKSDDATWAVVKGQGWLNQHLPEGWSWYKKEARPEIAETIAALIDRSPVPILGIERTPFLSRVVWTEPGKEFNAEALKKFLEEVQKIK